ncbi:MAG TPA: hypothetical protein DCE41_21090 [Cytophagales bacterium]|nr:hypothetical protein [Cytophagales bacterium]
MIITLLFTDCSPSNEVDLTEYIILRQNPSGTFDVIFDKDTDYEWVFTNVDSVSTYETGINGFLYGRNRKTPENLWYHITGAPEEFKKSDGGWYDGEFRKYRLQEIYIGDELYSRLKSTTELWEEHKQ